MAELYPFRGIRYDVDKIGDIGKVVTQPYDKISSAMRDRYLARHPENIARVIKNPNYEEAARYLDSWIEQGILRRDRIASFYPYEQDFEYQGEKYSRLGFIGLVSLEDGDLSVKGHENVLSKPLEDRLQLIRANEANDGLIFTLYSDPEMNVDQILSEFTARTPPEYVLHDEFGVRHRLWQLPDSEAKERVAVALQGKPLYIADGHHRYETARLYWRECLERGWRASAVESFDKRMVALFNMESPDVKILATHRAIRNLPTFNSGRLLEGLDQYFEIEAMDHLEELITSMGGEGHRIGLLTGDACSSYLLKLRVGRLEDESFMPEVSGIARSLDVSLLHEGILRPLLGIGPEELASQKYVDYLRDRSELAQGVKKGAYQAGFLLNATTVEEVRAISELGKKMPQKSTDFYPKLLTGLVLMKMEIEKE